MPSLNSNREFIDLEPALIETQIETIVRNKIDCLATTLAAVPDHEFLTAYAHEACEAIGADMFMIGRLNPYSNLVRSVRMVSDGKLIDDVVYSLDGTPCARAIDSGACAYSDNVADTFPRDKMLREFGFRGYVGTPFRTRSGQTSGIAVALTRTPIQDERIPLAVLEYFNDRVAATIHAAEEAERRDWAIAETTDGVWDWDMMTGGTIVSENLNTLIGRSGKGPCDLSKIEDAIHPEDLNLHKDALKKHLGDAAPYDLKLRLRAHSGGYRWYHSRGKAIRNDAGKPVRMIGCFSDIHDLMLAAERNSVSQ